MQFRKYGLLRRDVRLLELLHSDKDKNKKYKMEREYVTNW